MERQWCLPLTLLIYLFAITSLKSQSTLAPCPNSPNCVSTQAIKKRKRMAPIPYSGELSLAKKQLIALIEQMPGTTLTADKGLSLHFTFITKVGKFTDDVVFIFEEENQVIHFRSASRKGWHDLGANRRRMKRIGSFVKDTFN